MAKAAPQKTGPQIAIFSGGAAQPSEEGLAPKTVSNAWYAKARKMRRQPTIALSRRASVALLNSTSITWENSENAPEGVDEVMGLAAEFAVSIFRDALAGCIDYGWQPFELIWGFDETTKRNVLSFAKPLLQDITEPKVDVGTGELLGCVQTNPRTGLRIEIVVRDEAAVISIDMEAGDYYGEALMRAAEVPYDSWIDNEASAAKYNKKISGGHWLVKYPPGTSLVNGVDTDNFEIASSIANSLKSSSTIVVPSQVGELLADMKTQNDAWSVELISDSGASATNYIERSTYQDALFARALGWPERSLLEGSQGTKAEAAAHQALAISVLDDLSSQIFACINEQIITKLLELNFGEEHKKASKLLKAPLSDDTREYFRKLYDSILRANSSTELARLDVPAIVDLLEIPVIGDGIDPNATDPNATDPNATDPNVNGKQNGKQNATGLSFLGSASQYVRN